MTGCCRISPSFGPSLERYWSWLPRPLRIQLRHLTGQLPVGSPFGRHIRKAFSGAHLGVMHALCIIFAGLSVLISVPYIHQVFVKLWARYKQKIS